MGRTHQETEHTHRKQNTYRFLSVFAIKDEEELKESL